MTNLLSNAVKYGKGRPIHLVVVGDADRVHISVTDEGIGISPDALERIFERFERAAPMRHYGGLGLGLYVVAQIVDAHGGHIHVDSLPDNGATFAIDLPRDVTVIPYSEAPLRHH
jgi:signal transduction histidine kinase